MYICYRSARVLGSPTNPTCGLFCWPGQHAYVHKNWLKKTWPNTRANGKFYVHHTNSMYTVYTHYVHSLNIMIIFSCFYHNQYFIRKQNWRPNITAPKRYVAQTLRRPIGGAQMSFRPNGIAQTAAPKRQRPNNTYRCLLCVRRLRKQ